MSLPGDLHDPDRDDERLDLLTLAALSEPLDPDDAAHLQQCPRCAADLRELTRTVVLAREGAPPDPASDVRPPAAVWDAIAREVAGGVVRSTDTPDPAPVTSDTPSPVVPLDERRTARHRRRSRWLAVAAVAAIAAAGVGGWLVGRDTSGTADCPSITADLGPVDGAARDIGGRAELVCLAEGPALRVQTEQLPISTGFYEVWMYQPASGAMVPVGTLGSDGSGTFTLPGGMDVRDYPVIDVSAQKYDNDPTHGTSVLQGPLTR